MKMALLSQRRSSTSDYPRFSQFDFQNGSHVTFHFIAFIHSGCEAKDSQKSELNRYTSQEPHGEKTRKEVSVLDVGGKPQRII